ncbi:hypothetical protein [Flavobacterium branchiicola]|uniref:Outer membrane protein beta-barrel domain-containing protein n=1 Tax=Flavobacterium branchiicola TaxID=1114875 RepID=A0ABV9PDI9_9FLAO|nr:hypothetical protein [Flavobacterium branchiicola]MBS7254668.1 hypothetical protein [Flavobacterium branchiicola]
MKTTLFNLCFLIFGCISYGQVTTKNIIIDLNKPHVDIQACEDSSCRTFANTKCKCKVIIKTQNTAETNESDSGNDQNSPPKTTATATSTSKPAKSADTIYECKRKSKWLSIQSRDLLAIKLINGNPLKYTYKIDTKNLSFFNDKNINAEEVKEEAKNGGGSSKGLTKKPLKEILTNNEELIKAIDNLNIEVESLYKILTQKNTLLESDYAKREKFLTDAKENLKRSYSLINDLEQYKTNSQYKKTNEKLLLTKEKAEKSVDGIIQKFYTIDLDVHTLPIDVQGKNIDVVEFKLHRFDKTTKEEDINFAPNPYNIWIRGGLKIDVSAGIFFTSLYDEEYDKRDDPAIPDNKIITLKNSGDYDIAFGTTINTYIRMNSWVVPTLNFGAVLTKSEKLQVLFGVGAILGKQERIIFSTGVSMGKVDRIADSYTNGGSYNLGTTGTVPTQSQFDFGHFFGVTYNLSKVKKISLDKGIEEN